MSEDYEKRIAELETEYSEACEQAEIADIRLRDVMEDIARLRVARIAELEAQLAERDRYRAALQDISRGIWTARNSVETIVWIAQRALSGE